MNVPETNFKPLVSVAMITYNHDKFIAQAIEGVLMQKTDFQIRLIIGEDLSTDRTRAVCLEYQAKHPEVIEVLCREKNLGIQLNFMETIKVCDGKYVALCEGDDYWTDPLKLQKQVDFLENHSDFAVCHHRLQMIDEDDTQKRAILSATEGEVTTFEDLARRQHIMTASCIFRNKLFEFPEELFLNVYGTDYTLHLLNSYHGKIKLIDEAMGVYRIHNQGEWSGREGTERARKAINTIRRCQDYFAPRATAEFDFHATRMSCFLDFDRKEFKYYRKNCRTLLKRHFRFLRTRDLSALTARYFLSLFPSLVDSYAKISTRIKAAMKI